MTEHSTQESNSNSNSNRSMNDNSATVIMNQVANSCCSFIHPFSLPRDSLVSGGNFQLVDAQMRSNFKNFDWMMLFIQIETPSLLSSLLSSLLFSHSARVVLGGVLHFLIWIQCVRF